MTRYLPKETPASAIGHHFTFALQDRVIVGVAGDVRMRGLERRAEPQVYLPFRQVADGDIIGYIPRALVVRTVDAAGDARRADSRHHPADRADAAGHRRRHA